MKLIRKLLAVLALSVPRNDGKPDDRVFASFSGVIHSTPFDFPVALVVPSGPCYQLDFVERPELLSVARNLDRRTAVVSGLYGESFVDMPGFRSTTRTIRVISIFETKETVK